MFKFFKLFSIIIISLMTTNLFAFQYKSNSPLVFTWQTSSGKWRACGPVQCTSTSWNSREKVMSMVTYPKKHGSIRFVEKFGKCQAYIGTGYVDAGDYSPEKVIRLAKKRC
jgi:hypothetical protein